MLKDELMEQMLSTLRNQYDRPLAKEDVRAFFSAFSDIAAAELIGGGEIPFGSKFGKLKVKDIKARSGINPRNGAPIEIAARRRVCFIPSKELRESLCEQSAE